MNKKGKLIVYLKGGVPAVIYDAATATGVGSFGRNKPYLKTFTADLPFVTDDCYAAFRDAYNLTKFYGKLPALSYGSYFFQGRKLDAKSIKIVLGSIPKYTSGSHKLWIGYRTNWLNDEDIAKMLGTTTPIVPGDYNCYELKADGTVGDNKGWTINVQ